MAQDVDPFKGYLHRASNFSLEIAVEHVSWLRRQGVGMTEAMRSIGLPKAHAQGWDAVTLAFANEYDLMSRR